jgi:hypothetical protein
MLILRRRAPLWLSLALAAALAFAACATPSLDSALVAELAYIRIVDKAPASSCRYSGEAVSYRFLVSEIGIDIAGGEKQIEAMHDAELRKHARSVGANVVYAPLIHRTGYAFMTQVNVFYAC